MSIVVGPPLSRKVIGAVPRRHAIGQRPSSVEPTARWLRQEIRRTKKKLQRKSAVTNKKRGGTARRRLGRQIPKYSLPVTDDCHDNHSNRCSGSDIIATKVDVVSK